MWRVRKIPWRMEKLQYSGLIIPWTVKAMGL